MGRDNAAWQRTVELPVGYPNEADGTLGRTVTLRKMTGKEEALLADPKLRSNGGKLIGALLANCIVDLEGAGQIDQSVTRRLFSADRNFLLLELRRLTFGDEMEARYCCPSCQSWSTVMEDLSTLDVREVDNGALPEIDVLLRDGYLDPDGNWHYEFVFGLPTGEDEEVAAARRDSNPTRQRDALMARCLKRVGELEPKRLRAMGVRILADLSMADRRAIEAAMDEQTPGPDLTRHTVCERCGEEYRTTLDMSRFFSLA